MVLDPRRKPRPETLDYRFTPTMAAEAPAPPATVYSGRAMVMDRRFQPSSETLDYRFTPTIDGGEAPSIVYPGKILISDILMGYSKLDDTDLQMSYLSNVLIIGQNVQ